MSTVLFIDRSIGARIVPEALRAAGAQVEVHDDHFAQTTPDQEWLEEVTQRGWIVLTQDKRIRYRTLERMAVTQAGARLFVIVGGNLRAMEVARVLCTALPALQRVADAEAAPFIAKVYRSGRVELWLRATDLMAPN